jgi:hypothetical protein
MTSGAVGKAAELCIKNLRGVVKILERLDRVAMRKAMRSLDAGNSQMVIRDAIFNDRGAGYEERHRRPQACFAHH